MAGRGRGRANTLPAWMTKQGVNAPPSPGAARSPPPPAANAGPPPRAGQFDDAPEPNSRPPMMRNNMGEPSGGKRRSRSRDRGNGRNGGDFRGPPPMQERPRSRSRDRSNGRNRDFRGFDDRRREDPYRRGGPPRGRSRSRSRERWDYRGDYRRGGGGDRYEDRGYGARGEDYRRPMRRDEEAMERGYRRPAPNGHDDRTSRRYAPDYQP